MNLQKRTTVHIENAGRSSFRLSQERGIGLLLLIGFPFFFVGGPGYHAGRSLKSAWDLGHILFFFLATRLFLLVAAKRRGGKQRPFFFLQVFVFALGLGILIELIQKALGGRSVDGWDVYRDLLGCVAAYSVSELFPVVNRRFILPAIGVTLLVIAASWPLFRALVDENIARRQFPVLADFETPFEQNRFSPGRRLRREEKTAPQTRLMDMAHIESFAFFVVRQSRRHVIYVDNIYLGR